MKKLFATAAVLITHPFVPYAAEPIDYAKGCKGNPAVVGSCFALRGRVSAANGAYPMRIWPVGSKRYLAVLPAEDAIAPPEIKKQFSFERRIFADLVVCPFTEQRPEHMQFVCIESAKNIRIEHN